MTRLLVLDDEPEIGLMIGDIAEGFGFKVGLATAPAEFARMIGQGAPDVVVLDLVFPGGDGIEMLRFLQSEHYKGALILVSGTDSRVLATARRLGLALGLDVIGTMQKPFKMETVKAMLSGIAARYPSYTAGDLHAALENTEMTMHYQPVVDFRSRRVLGVEALLRWARPGQELTMPDEFLPSAAREGMMPELTRAVVEMALADASQWKRSGLDLRVAINVPASVVLATSFYDELMGAIRRCEPEAPRVMIELTETEAMGDPVRMMEVLSRLRLAGMELAIDDFGTGYSSLVELRRMPFSRLKIDKSFVLSCVREADASAITRAVIELSHALGISVVAEGVENEEIWKRLGEWKCDAAQGYFVARAMPGAKLVEWIDKWHQGAST